MIRYKVYCNMSNRKIENIIIKYDILSSYTM
jgi:hypothetical protein